MENFLLLPPDSFSEKLISKRSSRNGLGADVPVIGQTTLHQGAETEKLYE